VTSSQTFVNTSSSSSLELHSPPFKIPFNIPIQRAKSRRGLCLANKLDVLIMKRDASRISIALLIHHGILNRPYVLQTSPAGSDDENSCLLFSNRKNISDKICLVEFPSFW
jgi:hypothetical protein